ncbi:PRC-barrel domain-containing protein [Palleronia marisminoris]|uniref:PRC-barrel domain protein n=2 Tax=Palleronia marisminoris TaxID=315423 RepID=A0A1Y5RUN7_9RHOB|nr:PRC-barrel domain-containing protein [Palleronia marisminoris]SLN25782.1 PRC-barrel domain protein [Palleronia marisminoris]
MKRILSTSALTILMASGAAHAQQATEPSQIFADVPNDPTMLLGTDYIGQTVYSTLGNEAEASAQEVTTAPAEGEAPVDGEIVADPAADPNATATGESVATAQPQSVGQISDIIMTQDGQLEYVVLGVGGFLGIGEQNVAVNFDALSVEPDPQNEGEYMIMISASQEQIENAPEFDPALVEGTAQNAGTAETEANAEVETIEATTESDANVEVETTTESSSEMETVEPEVTTIESTGEEAAAETEQAVEGAAEEAEQAVEGAASETGQAVENAGEAVGNAAGEAASEAGQAVEQTGDAIENVTDEATSAN